MYTNYGRSLLIFLIFSSLLLAGCSGSDGLSIDCHVFEDNFDQVAETTIEVGDEITVTLCTLSNRGYHWSEEVQIDHPDVLEVLSHEYERGRSPMGGIPGKETWIFRALKPGTAVVSLEHTQPSGRNTAGVWTYQLMVNVNPASE